MASSCSAKSTKLRIRLLGIDTPEIAHGRKPGQPYGEEARDYLDHLIEGKTVRVDAYRPIAITASSPSCGTSKST